MAITGGYQIIDFNNSNLSTEQSITVPGVFSKISGTKKAILFENFKIEDIETNGFFPILVYNKQSNIYVFFIQISANSSVQFSIDSNDTVSIVSDVAANARKIK